MNGVPKIHDTMICHRAREVPVIVLRHTGGAADVVAESVIKGRQGKEGTVMYDFKPRGETEDFQDLLRGKFTLPKATSKCRRTLFFECQ